MPPIGAHIGLRDQMLPQPVVPLQVLTDPSGAESSAADESTTLSGTLTVSKSIVKQGAGFKLLLTLTNTGTQPLIGVHPKYYSLFVSGSGWLSIVKSVSPLVAALAPGESATFKYVCRAELPGELSLWAVGQDIIGETGLITAPTITVVPKKVGAAGASDAYGGAFLKVGSTVMPLHFIDESTGGDVPGLAVAVAQSKKDKGRALLAVIDPLGRFPEQLFLLEGEAAPAEAVPVEPPPPVTVPIHTTGAGVIHQVIETLQTGWMQPALEAAADVEEMPQLFKQVFTALAKSKDVPLPPPWSGPLPQTLLSTAMPSSEVAGFVNQQLADNAEVAFQMAAWCPPPESLPELAVSFSENLVPALTAPFSASVFLTLGYTTVAVDEISWGGVVIKMFRPADPSEIPVRPPTATLTVHAEDEQGQPCAGGCVELSSPTVLGLGLKAVLDTGGNADLPVPLGEYDATVCAEGKERSVQRISISGGGAALQVMLVDPPIESGTLSAPGPTGFLSADSQVQLTPTFKDANGDVAACNGPVLWQAFNPPGSTIATVDSNGLVSVNGGCGAARVTASCGNVSTLPKLISNDCGGKQPPPLSKPFVVNPVKVHFETNEDGVTTPAAHGIALYFLSEDVPGVDLTWTADWLSIDTSPPWGFNILADGAGLAGGTYHATVAVTNYAKPSQKAKIGVTLHVKAKPPAQVSGDWEGTWTWPVAGFCDETAHWAWHLKQSGKSVSGTYQKLVVGTDGLCPDPVGTAFTGSFFSGKIKGDTLTLVTPGGISFEGTVSGNSITGFGGTPLSSGLFSVAKP